jgi:hypothetical protein
MKTIVRLIALVALVATGGCVKLNMDTVIEEDGSGKTTFTYEVGAEVAAALAELQTMDTGMGDQEMPSLDDMTREKAAEVAKRNNIELEKFEKSDEGGAQRMEMVLAFENVTDLSRALSELMEDDSEDEILSIFRTGDGDYLLTSVADPNPREKAAEAPAPAEEPTDPSQMDPEQMQKSMELAGKLMAHMSEFDVRMTITVPGDIIESSSMTTEGRTAVWHVNAENMMSMQDQEFEPNIKFAGKGVKIEAPEWKE